MIGLGLIDRLHGGAQVWTVRERGRVDFFGRQNLLREFELAGDIEAVDRRAVVQQREQLDLGGAQIDPRRLQVGFELHALQLQPVQIHLRDIAGFETVRAHGQHLVVVGQVFRGEGHDGLLLQGLHEGIAQVEEQRALLIGELGFGHGGALLRALQTQFALARALVQIAAGKQGERAAQRTIGVAAEGRKLVQRGGQIGIGPQVRGDFLGLGLIDGDASGAQGGVGRGELLFHLLPREGRLRHRRVRQSREQTDSHPQAPGQALHFSSTRSSAWLTLRRSVLRLAEVRTRQAGSGAPVSHRDMAQGRRDRAW